MSVWAAIALTVSASACMNLGLVLQKRGIIPPENVIGRPASRRLSRHSPIWYFGMTLMIGGYAVYAVAVSARVAPISLLQPLSASGLLVVALLAVVYLNERFDFSEWLGVAILLAGVISLGLSARGPQHVSTGIETASYLGFFAVVAAIVVGTSWMALRAPGRAELLLGILSGLLFGTGYLNTKALALAIQDRNLLLAIAAGCLMTIGLLGGLVALQLGLRFGRALIVTAVNLVTNQVLVVAGGLVCLGESFPHQSFAFAARLAGFAGILIGILLLARVGATSAQSRPAEQGGWHAESKPLSF